MVDYVTHLHSALHNMDKSCSDMLLCTIQCFSINWHLKSCYAVPPTENDWMPLVFIIHNYVNVTTYRYGGLILLAGPMEMQSNTNIKYQREDSWGIFFARLKGEYRIDSIMRFRSRRLRADRNGLQKFGAAVSVITMPIGGIRVK